MCGTKPCTAIGEERWDCSINGSGVSRDTKHERANLPTISRVSSKTKYELGFYGPIRTLGLSNGWRGAANSVMGTSVPLIEDYPLAFP